MTEDIDSLRIRLDQRTALDVVRRIEQGGIVMTPEFHREFIWGEDKQSRLIESVLLRIPLPAFYLTEDLQGRLTILDGLQRLTALARFMNNSFKLKLPGLPEVGGKSFCELPPRLQNRIEDCQLSLGLVGCKVSEKARLDIFKRVNRS